MLDLESPAWAQLQHAYGPAADVPELLRALEEFPADDCKGEPWFSIWSALAHQGDVYSASFAAVPHVVRILATDPQRATRSFFQFPAWVEICREKAKIGVPADLLPAYREALRKIPELAASAATRDWDGDFLACALSAIAVAKGQPKVAEAALELTPEVATEFLEWFFSR